MSKDKNRAGREPKKPKASKVKTAAPTQGFAALHTPKPQPPKSEPPKE